mgnify:FL=1
MLSKKICAVSWLFTLGAVVYSVIEVLFRGYTHWTMTLCGGLCLVSMCGICRSMRKRSLCLRCVACGMCITAVEFAAGCIVNLWLGWNVWDYSARRGNILGQVCPVFTLFWSILSLPVAVTVALALRRGEKSAQS